METFIVKQYDTPNELEKGLNSYIKEYFPIKIFNNKGYYTVVYCKKSIIKPGVVITCDNNYNNKKKQILNNENN